MHENPATVFLGSHSNVRVHDGECQGATGRIREEYYKLMKRGGGVIVFFERGQLVSA